MGLTPIWRVSLQKRSTHRHTEGRRCEAAGRRWPSASQQERSREKAVLPTSWSWTPEKTNFFRLMSPACTILLGPPKQMSARGNQDLERQRHGSTCKPIPTAPSLLLLPALWAWDLAPNLVLHLYPAPTFCSNTAVHQARSPFFCPSVYRETSLRLKAWWGRDAGATVF